MPNDPVTDALNSAKSTLEKANKFTESAEGNSTSAFAPKKPEAPKIPQAHKPSYSLASQARAQASGYGDDVAKGLKARSENVKQYTDANKQ